MKKSQKASVFTRLRTSLPHLVTGTLTLALVFFGSLDKKHAGSHVNFSNFTIDDYANASTDQISELYTVASATDALNLSGANNIAANYIVTSALRNSGQSSADKLEKPSIIYSSSRGVITHTVAPGETIDSIAQKYHLTANQIRWSNGLKTNHVSAGTTLFLSSRPGIVYTVKSGDTLESIVKKYGSSIPEIIALNDLETSSLTAGKRIIIHEGSLPEQERPEYVPPVRFATYSFLGGDGLRINRRWLGWCKWCYNNNPYNATHGECVWFTYAWRASHGLWAPARGNARDWVGLARAAGRKVDRTPSKGAIFWNAGGWGHVGVVVSDGLNPDGTITVQETNYLRNKNVLESEIPANQVGRYWYIH